MHSEYGIPLFAVVTGASHGIGYELAKQFVKNGFDLLVVAENPEIIEIAQALGHYGTRVESLETDLATYEGVDKLYDRIKAFERPLEVFCVHASIGAGGRSVDKTDFNKEFNLLKSNIISVVHLTRRVLPNMIERGHGRILFTSSSSADFEPEPYEPLYSASKSFLESFAQSIRAEVADKGITVTALKPGEVASEGFEALMEGRDGIIAAKMHERQTQPHSPLVR